MAHPIASSSQPAQIPALDTPLHVEDKTPKVKKVRPANVGEFPLEVRFFFLLFIPLTEPNELASTTTCIL